MLAAFQLLIIVWMFRKYSEDYWFSIFLFIASTDYISWTFNGIRQFTAVVIAYAATPFILKKNTFQAFLLFVGIYDASVGTFDDSDYFHHTGKGLE